MFLTACSSLLAQDDMSIKFDGGDKEVNQLDDVELDSSLWLLEPLREALFPPDEPKISAKDHPKGVEGEESRDFREWASIDTIILVRLHQPDKQQVCDLLLQIAMTKNNAYFQPLMEMYKQHQNYFKEEWEYLRKSLSYACQVKSDPITIMQAFEQTLYALELAHNNASQSEIIRLYDKHKKGYYEYIFFRSEDRKLEIEKRRDINNQINYYSPYFKNIRSRFWASYGPGFSFYTPYLGMLEDHLVNRILSLDVQKHKYSENQNYEDQIEKLMIESAILDIRRIKSRKFEQAIEKKYEEIVNVGWSYTLSRYVQLNENISPEFVIFLLDRSFEGQSLIDDYNRIGSFATSFSFLIQEHTRPVIKEYLLNKLKSDNPVIRAVTLNCLMFYSNEPEILKLMLDKSKKRRLSPEESKVLKISFKRMLKASDFPEGEKESVRKALRKLEKRSR